MSEVSSIRLLDTSLSQDDGVPHILQNRNYMSQNFLRNGKDARYAIKTLSTSLLKDPERFVAGVIDLVLETKFLSILRHQVSTKNWNDEITARYKNITPVRKDSIYFYLCFFLQSEEHYQNESHIQSITLFKGILYCP